MAVYYISGCTNLVEVVSDFNTFSVNVNGVYYLTFTGSTPEGCYTIVSGDTIPTDGVLTVSSDYVTCVACGIVPTPTPTPTPSATVAVTPTPSGTAAVTPTPSGTAGVTPTPTRTPPSTPTNTPTPSATPFYSGISVNQNYEYTAAMLGSFSGGTLPPGTNVPHPEYASDLPNGETIQVVQLNAITLGGFNGLNN